MDGDVDPIDLAFMKKVSLNIIRHAIKAKASGRVEWTSTQQAMIVTTLIVARVCEHIASSSNVGHLLVLNDFSDRLAQIIKITELTEPDQTEH